MIFFPKKMIDFSPYKDKKIYRKIINVRNAQTSIVKSKYGLKG